MFKVFALTFWGRWLEISLCCFHPFGYDLGMVLCVISYDLSHVYGLIVFKVFASSFWGNGLVRCLSCLSHAYSCLDKVFASSFWGRWWQISLCCCHPLEYDLGVVLYVLCHFVHANWYLDWIFDVFASISEWHFDMVAASHCSCFSQCAGRGQGSAAGAAEDHMTLRLDA